MQPENNLNQPRLRNMEPIKPSVPASPVPPRLSYIPPTTAQPSFTPPPPPPRHNSRSSSWRSIVSTLILFLLAPAIALFIAAFVVQSYQVDGQSMEPTLQDNDRLIVDKWQRSWARITKHTYVPARGDVIIFNQSGVDLAGSSPKQLIKRVIGLPGERLVVANGKITVYNDEYPDGFNPDAAGSYSLSTDVTAGNVDVTLETNEIFVCGDNRANSEDSRYFGPVDASQVVGKLAFRIVPLDKARKF
jgi:signal peptidase I